MKRQMLVMLTVCLALASLTGCFKVHMFNPNVDPKDGRDEWTNFFFFGLVGHAEIDARDFCKGEEVARIDSGMNFGTWFVGWITLGIYTPNIISVWCGTPSSQKTTRFEIELDSAGIPVRVTEHRPDGRPRSAAPWFSASAQKWAVALPAREAL